MSFLMLFEFSTVNVFAKGGDGDLNSVENRNTEKPKYVDYCKDYPKNKYNNSESVRCAIKSEFPGFKADEGSFILSIPKLGKTGEIDVYMWKYAALEGLATQFENWIKNADIRAVKGQFLSDFIKVINNFFGLSSNEDNEEFIETWVKDVQLFKTFEYNKKRFR